jgi:hypothetical protein
MSAPIPRPTPTTPTAARAPAHFSIPRLETLVAFSLAGFEFVKTYSSLERRKISRPIYPL